MERQKSILQRFKASNLIKVIGCRLGVECERFPKLTGEGEVVFCGSAVNKDPKPRIREVNRVKPPDKWTGQGDVTTGICNRANCIFWGEACATEKGKNTY